MRRILVFVIAVILTIAGAAVAEEASGDSIETIVEYSAEAVAAENVENPGPQLRVCSYNIGHYNNGSSEIGMKYKVLFEKLDLIREFFAWAECDVYCLQEDAEFIDRKESINTTKTLFDPLNLFSVDSGETTLRSKTEITDSELLRFSTNRAFQYGKTIIDGKEIMLISTHFYPKEENIDKREKELIELFAWLDEQKPDYYIICGDFNTSTDEDHEYFRDMCYANGAKMANGGEFPWQITRYPDKALDNIIVSGNIEINEFTVLYDWYDALYSDHIPIIATLTILE